MAYYPPTTLCTLACPTSPNGHIPALTITVYEEVNDEMDSRFTVYKGDQHIGPTFYDLMPAMELANGTMFYHLLGH